MFVIFIITTRGRSNVISTSKIRKIIAIRKNRNENGRRADPLGSNPHSKGDIFSRSEIVFLASREERAITNVTIKIVIIRQVDNIKIILSISLGLLIGNQWY